MAHAITLTVHAPHVEEPGLLARLRQAVACRREYHATCEELGALSDRQLADIGLPRWGVREAARAAVYAD
jgi:uncharacterized protein YjiS (DUF1127 family)